MYSSQSCSRDHSYLSMMFSREDCSSTTYNCKRIRIQRKKRNVSEHISTPISSPCSCRPSQRDLNKKFLKNIGLQSHSISSFFVTSSSDPTHGILVIPRVSTYTQYYDPPQQDISSGLEYVLSFHSVGHRFLVQFVDLILSDFGIG